MGWREATLCQRLNHLRTQQHAFPHDYRSGPSAYDWDPSKWVILSLNTVGLATGLRRVRDKELDEARLYILNKQRSTAAEISAASFEQCPSWTLEKTREYAAAQPGRCVLVVNGLVIDATAYLGEHVSHHPSAPLSSDFHRSSLST